MMKKLYSPFFIRTAFVVLLMLTFVKGWGQIEMTTTGNYTQDFNSLISTGNATWTNNSTIANWYAIAFTNPYVAEAGAGNSGGLKSYGTGTSTERALGSLGSGSANPAYGVVLRNTSGTTITDIKVTYTGEQWRNGGVTATQPLAFYYAKSATAITSITAGFSGYTAVAALNFTSLIGTTTAGALDGNAAANRTTKTNIPIPTLSLADGEYIILKWDDINDSGNDHGLSIDDVNISWTVPPSTPADVALSSLNPASTAGNLSQASTNNVIYGFDLGVTTANASLSQVIFNTTGSYANTDVSNFKLWYSTDAVFNPGSDTQIGTAITTGLGTGSHTFASLSRSITAGLTGYFFITTDIPCNAENAKTIRVNAITTGNLTFSGTPNKTGTAFDGATHNITSATANNVTGASTSLCTNNSTRVNWTAPTTCYDEVLVFAKAGAFTSAIPTGDGSSYVANVTFGSGTPFDGGTLIYKGTLATVTALGLTNGTNYEYKIFTRNDSNWSNGVVVNCTPTIEYCSISSWNSGDSEVLNVSLTGEGSTSIANPTTGCTNTVQNYTAQSANLYPGSSYSVAVTFGDCDGGTRYDGAGGVWIDWNNDGDFADANETIGTTVVTIDSPAGPTQVSIFTINVPVGQAIGNYRMRVVQDEDGTIAGINPCSAPGFGSIEDYTVNIITACTPPTNPVGAISGTTPACGSTTLTYTGADSANAYWQTTATGTSTAEPATVTKSVSASGTYYVRIYSGTCWSTATVNLPVVINNTPIITTQPTDQSVAVGATATYNVVATGGSQTYQWQESPTGLTGTWVNVGTDSNTLSLTNLQLDKNNYKYQVVITNPCSTVTSNVVNLAVTLVPVSIWSNTITGTNPSTGNPYTIGDTKDANIVVSGISRGPGIVENAANDRYNATNWSTAITMDPQDYFEFTLQANSGYKIDLSSFVYTGQRSGSGPQSFALRSSEDGYATNIGAANATGTTISLNSTDYKNLTHPITFRFYGWNASGGTYSINDFQFNGNVIATSNTPTTYTWVGTANTSWLNPANWSPNGVPTPIDNVIINTSPSNLLNIISNRAVNNFTLNGTGNFNISDTGILTIKGDVSYGGTATATLNCASTINITNPFSQTIPALNYGNLSILGGNRTFSSTEIIRICSAFAVNPSLYTYTVDGSTVEYTSQAIDWVLSPFTYNNLIFSGTGNFSIGYSDPAVNKTVTVLGNYSQTAGTVYLGETSTATATLNVDGNLSISGGSLELNRTNGGRGTLNLKGNLSVTNSGNLSATSTTVANTNFNFVGNVPQTINVVNSSVTQRITFNVTSGASTKLDVNNLALGTNSRFNVLSGGTLDFGFAGSTALNITGNGITGTGFSAAAGSYLKITSPAGISNTSGTSGNIQTNTAPLFIQPLTYHYNGNENQIMGTGVGSASNGKAIIVDLANKDLTLTPSTAFGITSNVNANVNGGNGGILDIRTGRLVETDALYITGGSTAADGGTLKMVPDTYYKITRISGTGESEYIPRFYNTTITGGEIELASTGNQTLRGGKTYYDLTFSNGATKEVSDGTADINGLISIMANTTLDGKSFTIGKAETELLMDSGSLFKTGGNGAKPDAGGDYVLDQNSTIEFQGTSATKIKVTPQYENVNVSGTNVETGGKNFVVNQTLKAINPVVVTESSLLTISEVADNVAPYVVNAKKGIQVASRGQVLFKNNAQLMQDAGASNIGNIKMERVAKIPVSTFNQFVYWSSPVIGQNFKTIFGGDAEAMYYNETNNKFYASSGAYIAGRGLAVKNPVIANSAGVTSTAAFTGTPYNTDLNYNLAFSNADHGYNLVGNPYPSNLDLNELYTNNSGAIESTFRFWDNTNNAQQTQLGSTYNGSSYAIYNASSGTGIPSPGDGSTAPNNPGKKPNNILKVGQGFLVRAKVASAVLGFKGTQRITAQTNAQFYGKTSDSIVDRYLLELVTPSNLVFSNAVVYFDNGNNSFTQDDSKFDAGLSEGLFTKSDEEKVVINGRSIFTNNDIIKLGSRNFIAGNNVIRLGTKEGVFANGQNIYLKDKQTGIITNLSQGSYTFSADIGEINNRFEIIYKPEAILASDAVTKESLQVYRNGENFIVKSGQNKIDKVEVYDVTGRLVKSVKGNSSEIIIEASSLSSGMYILNINRNNQTINKKIIK